MQAIAGTTLGDGLQAGTVLLGLLVFLGLSVVAIFVIATIKGNDFTAELRFKLPGSIELFFRLDNRNSITSDVRKPSGKKGVHAK